MSVTPAIKGADIAIIGMAGRFPGATSVDQLWNNLCEGRESITIPTDSELRAAGVPNEAICNPNYIRARARIRNVEYFDASFFGMTAGEAQAANPQTRLFLESAWEALEDAGYGSGVFGGLIGLYAGSGSNGYLSNCMSAGLGKTMGPVRLIIVNEKDHLTTFTAYKLNLRGPSVTVQTACSTSLVAVHVACQALIGGECDLALAGGASIDVAVETGRVYQEGGILSRGGHCRAFDAFADGTVGGSGVALVVLKPLESALRDGDNVRAVVKGSAINNDGSRKLGYTSPSIEGQERVLREAYAVAGVDPKTITYIEAHGTGTPLGDPMEVEALMKVCSRDTRAYQPCAIGSIKTNIGHLDAASGVAGLIKAVFSVEQGVIPPSLHFERPNPKIDFADSGLFVNTVLARWDNDLNPRRAGVSSFGIGGTNAHVIVEQAPLAQPSDCGRKWQLVSLSARTEGALASYAEALAHHCREKPDLSLADAAWTLHVGRPSLTHRLALVASSASETAALLEAQDTQLLRSSKQSRFHPIVFVFPGQGAQYPNMARELYETEDTFREELERCFDLIRKEDGPNLKNILFPANTATTDDQRTLDRTENAQIGIFAISYALAKLWIRWGITPQAMIGHSIGEYVAACLAGCWSLEDAIRLVIARGQLMQQQPAGAMLAVALPENEVRAFLKRELSLAAVNGPTQCVVSGSSAAIEQLHVRLTHVSCQRLHTSHAYHSVMMEPIRDQFAQLVSHLHAEDPKLPFISSVTGKWITARQAGDPAYWATHMCSTVRFLDGCLELMKEPNRIYLEVGPGHTLTALIRRLLDTGQTVGAIPSLASQLERRSDIEALLTAAGKLWTAGASISWEQFYATQLRRRIRLPTYPFERNYYWVQPPASKTLETHDPSESEGRTRLAVQTGLREPIPTDPQEIIEAQLHLMSQQLDSLSKL